MLEIFPEQFILFEVLLGPASLQDPMVDWVGMVIAVTLRRLIRYIVNSAACKRGSGSLSSRSFRDLRVRIVRLVRSLSLSLRAGEFRYDWGISWELSSGQRR